MRKSGEKLTWLFLPENHDECLCISSFHIARPPDRVNMWCSWRVSTSMYIEWRNV